MVSVAASVAASILSHCWRVAASTRGKEGAETRVICGIEYLASALARYGLVRYGGASDREVQMGFFDFLFGGTKKAVSGKRLRQTSERYGGKPGQYRKVRNGDRVPRDGKSGQYRKP